jgi:hypothetical protein
MSDLFVVAVIVGFAILTWALLVVCDRLAGAVDERN